MEIINAYPPNIEEIEKTFDLTGKKPVFAYGKVLFNPHYSEVDQFLLAHEMTHMAQQSSIGVVAWWQKYLADPAFRLKQEVEAYHAQYKLVCKLRKDRNRIARYLSSIATDLSSAMYGNLVSYQDALRFIKNGNYN